MAYYWKLRRLNAKHRKHVANRLLALRAGLREQVLEKKGVGELRIATWNLMHFGGSGGYKRSTESLQYIAEIIDHFDLVSIQEVKRDLSQLKVLLKDYLGSEWDYVVSDVTEGSAGNDERMAVLYHKERVVFSREAGEIVLPPVKGDDGEIINLRQLARSPFYLGFQAGWFKFKLCSVHIHYGAKSGVDRQLRVDEISALAQQLKKRSNDERKREVKYLKQKKYDTTPSAANYVLLGDFNIHEGSPSKVALTGNGFDVPDDIEKVYTNMGAQREPFDQIAVRIKDQRFKQGAGGVFDYRDFIYRDGPDEEGAILDSDFYRTLSKSHVEKLKDREQKLLEQPTSKRNAAAKKREKATTATQAKAQKLIAQADKLETDAAELEAQMADQEFLETYLSEGVNEYFKRYYRKNQISDHLLLWTSFKIDYATHYLEKLVEGGS